MEFLNKAKDKLFSFAIKKVVDFTSYKRYGRVLKFNLDSKNNKVELEVLLEGENEPTIITINNYEIIKENNTYFIIVKEFKCSKKWLSRIANDFLVNNKFKLPKDIITYLKVIGVIKE